MSTYLDCHSKILGQKFPSAASGEQLYSPNAITEVQGTLMICNQSATADTVRVALLRVGDSLSAKNYIFYDVVIDPNSTVDKTFEIGPLESVWVYSTNGTCSFTATGLEITQS